MGLDLNATPIIGKLSRLVSFISFFSDLVVTSGFRFYYDKPRMYDASMLTMGVRFSNGLIIPPKQENWISSGACTKACSSVNIQYSFNFSRRAAVKSIANIFHMSDYLHYLSLSTCPVQWIKFEFSRILKTKSFNQMAF